MKKALATLLLFSIMLANIASCDRKSPDTSDTAEIATDTIAEETYPHSDMELIDGTQIIGNSNTLEIPTLYLKYFFADSYQTFCAEYAQELSEYFDTSIPLHDQVPTKEGFTEYATWYDYFLKIAKSSLEYYIALYEQAVKNSITLSKEELDSITTELDSYKTDADGYKMTFEEYMDERFGLGDGATYEIMNDFLQMCELGNKYGKSNYNSAEYTDDEIEKVFEEKKYDYLFVDYDILTIYPDFDMGDSDDKIAKAKDEAKKLADDFISYVQGGDSYLDAYKKIYPDKTQYQYSKFESECHIVGDTYYYDDEEKKSFDEVLWMHEAERKVGDVTSFTDSEGRIKIVRAAKIPYRKEFPIPDIRICYISLQDGTYDETSGEELCKTLVERINNAENKEAEMLAVVEQYSADASTKGNGGLVSDITPTFSSLPVDVASWCYKDGRAVGDVTYMKYEYSSITTGYFVVYLDSFGLPYWKYLTLTYMKNVRMNELISLWLDQLTIEYNEEMTDRLFK